MPAGKVKSSPTQHKSERLRNVTHTLCCKTEKAWNDVNGGGSGGSGPGCPTIFMRFFKEWLIFNIGIP